MTLRTARVGTALFLFGLALTACQEQLTAPGSCPAACPGGTPVLRDTVLDALPGKDSSHAGYTVRGATGAGMLVSNGFLGATDYGVVQFLSRSDTVIVRDTGRTYTIDSVAISVSLLARDTTASGILLSLYRIPKSIDTSVDFTGIDTLVVPGTLIDSITIADSVRKPFTYRFVFKDSTLAKVAIPAGDSGVFAMALAISGGTATGVRMGGIVTFGLGPEFRSYITVNIPDTTAALKHQLDDRGSAFTTYVSSAPVLLADSTVLTLGTIDGVRSLIRFPWPVYLRDSALLARATLELVPVAPIQGLSSDSAFVELHGVQADFGAKSPVLDPFLGEKGLVFGSSDTVRVDIIAEVRFWQRARLPHPPLLVAEMSPGGASFTEPRFYSTREPIAARRPRLRITYQLPFDFERP